MREETGQLLWKVPHIGSDVQKWARRAEELAKGAILPGLLFEELGFRYAGPIDGHNFEHLLPTLDNALKMKGPVLLHVITKKGLGYEPAMKNPVWFHACPPFVRETGAPAKKAARSSYTQSAIESLVKLARADKRIVAVTAALCEGTGLHLGICKYSALRFVRRPDESAGRQRVEIEVHSLRTNGIHPCRSRLGKRHVRIDAHLCGCAGQARDRHRTIGSLRGSSNRNSRAKARSGETLNEIGVLSRDSHCQRSPRHTGVRAQRNGGRRRN